MYFEKVGKKNNKPENEGKGTFFFVFESEIKEVLYKFTQRFDSISGVFRTLILSPTNNQSFDNRRVWYLNINPHIQELSRENLLTDIRSLLLVRTSNCAPATIYVCCYIKEKLCILHSSRMGTATEQQADELTSNILRYQLNVFEEYKDNDFVHATTVKKDTGFNEEEKQWIDECVKNALISSKNAIHPSLSSLVDNFVIKKTEEEGPSYEQYYKIQGIEPNDIKENKAFETNQNNKILGLYQNTKVPNITLYTKNIHKCVLKLSCIENESLTYELLFKKVLLHELSHAILDASINVVFGDSGITCSIEPIKTYSLPSSIAMEESIANYMALDMCKEVVPNASTLDVLYEFVNNHQPPIYSFALQQDSIGADWTKWKETKKEVVSILKAKGTDFLSHVRNPSSSYTVDDYEDSLLSIVYQLIGKSTKQR